MKILIVSYHFYPKNTPRAFRTHELVKEFCKRGFDVTLILPKQVEYINEIDPQLKNIENFEVVLLGKITTFRKPSVSKLLNKENRFRKVAKGIYRYFNPYTETKPYIDLVYQHLKNTSTKYDMIISIAHPFSTLVGTAKAIRRNPILRSCPIKIAEYSDPFSLQNNVKMFLGYKIVDRWIAKTFDYISIPTEKAIESYKQIKAIEKIKVIPQGFNFEDIELATYKRSDIPTFGYAGVFYEKIRNPEVLFNFLATLKSNFRFHLFTSLTNKDTNIIIEKYQNILRDKLIINYNVPRLSLIKELSLLDFLINIDNTSANQVPSKLIDYSLTDRPIFSFSQNDFNESIFSEFLKGNYSNSLKINLEDYDIKNVVNKFLSLK